MIRIIFLTVASFIPIWNLEEDKPFMFLRMKGLRDCGFLKKNSGRRSG